MMPGQTPNGVHPTLGGYEVVEKLGESSQAIVYRGFHRRAPERPIVLKVLKSASLTENQRSHFRLKIEQLKVLQHPGVLLPLSFEEKAETKFITYEYFEAMTLNRWAQIRFREGVALSAFFGIARQLAQILDGVHKAGIIHGGIKPNNILVHEPTSDVRIIDFITPFDVRDASHFIYDPAFVLGTLAYTSPEQTGRISHRVDFTTDLYSLGIIFYELLTGQLPFRSLDPLELIHSHLAEEAPPVHALNESTPKQLSWIVAKLTLKQPEKRYQSGAGLCMDLRQCEEEYTSTGAVSAFPLGRHDRSHRVVFVSKMVGRDREASIILDEYAQAAKGAFRSVLISGLPGIGKTRLIQELQRPIVKCHGYFTAGKFDVYQKNIPYSSLIQALRNLVRTFLTESEDRVRAWREKILAAVAPNGKVIADVVPELTALIGPQPPVKPLPPVESRTRFHDLFGKFLTCLVSESHPLTMFIDDLQWCDAGSFDFLANIFAHCEEHPYLFLLGAYRHNEVDASHPLRKLIKTINQTRRPLKEIRLGPLAAAHSQEMVSYILDSPLSQTEALSHFIADLTEGNPLFVSESLSYLHNENLLFLDKDHCWHWDLEKIRCSEMPSSVVALFSSKVRKLPPGTIDLLEYAACMGNTFSADELASAREVTLRDSFEALKPALGMGLLMESRNQLQFIHDRVQEAVLGDIDEQRRREIHWRIGDNLLARTPEGKPLSDLENFFTIVSHLNLGKPRQPDADTAYRLSDLNFQAGDKALNSLATDAANAYFQISLDLLPPGSWEVQYDKTFKIIEKLAKTDLMAGRYESSEKLLNDLLAHARTDLDKAEALAEQTTSLSSVGNFIKAIETANRGLAFFGKSIPDDPDEAEKKRGLLMNEVSNACRDIWDTILNMPFTTDRRSKIELAFYSELIPDLYMSGLVPQLYLSAVQSTLHCLQGGMDESVIYSFSIMGLSLGEKGDFEQAFKYEDLARNLSDKYPNTFGATRGMNGVVWCNMHSRSHPEEVVEYCLRSIQCGKNCGDLYNAGLSYGPLMWNLQVQGASLSAVEECARECLLFSNRYHLGFSVGLAEAVLAGWIAPMKGTDAQVPIEERLGQWRAQNHIASAGSYHVLRGVSCYLGGEYEESERHLEEVKRYLNGLTDNVLKREWYVFQILNAVKLHERGARYTKEEELLAYVEPIHAWIRRWAELGPTLRPYLTFVEAELARTRGEFEKARSLYMDAMTVAHQLRFTLLEGHLHECMAELLQSARRGTHLIWCREAARLYRQCGADHKLRRLEARHSECLEESVPAPPPSTAAPDEGVRGALPPLDLDYLMRSSLAIAGDSNPETLLGTILRAVLQTSGAQLGYLLIEEEGELYVCAETHSAQRDVVRTDRRALDEVADVCKPIVRYVYRTREKVNLDNASEEGPFRDHSEVQKLRLQSVLCLPLMRQSDLIGVLYLENRLSTSVFTGERALVTDQLSAHAAISLQNARLLLERKRAEAKLRETNDYLDKLLTYANAPIVVCTPEMKIARFNHAFERLTGYEASEIVGQHLSTIFPETSRDASLDGISCALAKDPWESVEVPIRRKDGDTRMLLWNSANVYAEDGVSLVAMVAQGQDITDRKRLTEQLLQSQKMEAVGRLAGGVAHDFNNLLTAILGYGRMLATALGESHPLSGDIEQILKAGERAAGLTRQLLAFSRKQVVVPEVLDLNLIVANLEKMLRRLIGEDIALEVRLDPAPLLVKADPGQMEQIVVNLSVNARDAMPHGGVLSIETRNVATEQVSATERVIIPPGTYALLSVKDTGAGMDEETKSHLFEPFFTTKGTGKGTGLGLATVHGIVQQSDGHICVHSVLGKGTLFEVYIPSVEGAVAPMRITERDEESSLRGLETVLVVEDDTAVRELAREVLEARGYEVLAASGGRQALDAIARFDRPVHLIISDVVMPGMSGPDLVMLIGASLPGVKVLYMSGYTDDAVLHRGPPAAGVAYLQKPFTPEEFLRKVRMVLDET